MKPVVVIGGGPAGIASAIYLSQKGVKTLLVERSARLGGRAASFFFPRMREEVDYGQHVLMRCCKDSIRLLELLGQKDAVSFQPRLDIVLSDEEKKINIKSSPLIGPLHILPSLLFYSFLTVSERMRVMRAGLSLLLKDAGETSFGEWLSFHGQTTRAINLLWDPICVATLNAHVHDVSASIAQLVFQKGFFRPHGADIGLFKKPLSEIFSSAIPFVKNRRGEVFLGSSARRIAVDDGQVQGVEMSNGEVIQAIAVISAVSHTDLGSLLPESALQDHFFGWLLQIQDSPIVDVHLWFDCQVMEELFVVGLSTMSQAVFDVSAIHGDLDKHHITVSRSAATALINMPVQKIVELTLSGIEKLLPLSRNAKLLDSLVIKSKKATFVPSPRIDTVRPPNIAPIRGLFLAGDYTATAWPSTIEGAIRSGMNAAEAVLARY